MKQQVSELRPGRPAKPVTSQVACPAGFGHACVPAEVGALPFLARDFAEGFSDLLLTRVAAVQVDHCGAHHALIRHAHRPLAGPCAPAEIVSLGSRLASGRQTAPDWSR
jgi:hypothetical protein